MDESEEKVEEVKTEKVTAAKKSNPLFLVVVALVVIGLIAFLVKGKQQVKVEKTQSPVSTTTETQAKIIEVEGGSFYFKPNQVKANVGEKVKIVFKNLGSSHNFVIDEFGVQTKLTVSGETSEVEFTPNKAGTFEFYCSVGNHRAMGMKGTLVVE